MENNYLVHFGIKGMKWGVRRFQNKDGSRTPAGRKRYGDSPFETTKDKLTFSNKRSLRKLASNYGNMIKGDHVGQKGEQYGAIGENSKRVINSRRRDFYNLDSTKKFNSYLDEWYKENPRLIPTKEVKYQELLKQYGDGIEQLKNSYIDRMEEAYLKDLEISNIQKGKEYLSKYL